MKLYGIASDYYGAEYFEMADLSRIAVYGNDWMMEHIPDNVKTIWDALDYDLMDALGCVGDGDRYNTKREAIEDVLCKIMPLELNNYKVGRLSKIADAFYNADRKTELELLCEALELLLGGKWTTGTIRGFSQGDWQNIIYDATHYSDKEIEYIEATYFGTATEWFVVQTERDCDTIEAICEEYDREDGYCTLTISDAKRELAEATGIEEDDITLYYISGYTQSPKYELVV